MHEKAKLQERITTGEIVIGDKVVPTTYDYYSVDSHCRQTVNVCARRIPLKHIREKLLKKHGFLEFCGKTVTTTLPILLKKKL